MRTHARFDARLFDLARSAPALVVALFSALAACGGGAEQGPAPQAPGTAAPSASAAASAPIVPGAPGAPAASGSVSVPPTAPAPMGPMKPIAASAFAEDLRKLGIDPLKPQPLNKLSPDMLRKLMPTFSKSLGVKCAACHDTDNFKAWTPKKRVASKMWQEFVVGMTMDDGTPLYCDSCHGGKMQFLDRHDKKALSAWMDANYVKKLSLADKKDETSCEHCHGDPFEGKILDKWEVSAK